MSEIKRAGNFLYQYRGKNSVAIAMIAVFSNMTGQMQVNQRMSGIAKRTGYYCDLEYEGKIYTAIVFETIPEEELIAVLEQS